MLINSANLMGGSTEPDGTRGFGRVHLEPGMPLGGEGELALFVADSLHTRTPELTLTEYSFEVDGSAGLDLRATLAWIDPPTTVLSSVQVRRFFYKSYEEHRDFLSVSIAEIGVSEGRMLKKNTIILYTI